MTRRTSPLRSALAAAALAASGALGCSIAPEHPGRASGPPAPTTDVSSLRIETSRGWVERGQGVEVFLVNDGNVSWVQPWFDPAGQCLEAGLSVRSVAGDEIRGPAPCEARLEGTVERSLAPGERVTVGFIDARELRGAPGGAYVVELPVGEHVLTDGFELAPPPREIGEVNLVTGVLELMDLSLELAKVGQGG